MKIKELIKILEKLNQESEIYFKKEKIKEIIYITNDKKIILK